MTSGHVDSGSISRPEKIKSVSMFVTSCNVNSEWISRPEMRNCENYWWLLEQMSL